jgi:hypothetical protein
MGGGVEEHVFWGSSIRILKEPTPNMVEFIVGAKLALASKPICKMPPPPTVENIQAIMAQIKSLKLQNVFNIAVVEARGMFTS